MKPARDSSLSEKPQELPLLDSPALIENLKAQVRSHQREYLAMYSSWYGGIVREPALMLVPLDDHMVHRGDGVFEAFKCVAGKIYLLDRHMDRLQRSADLVGLVLPMQRRQMIDTIEQTIRAAGEPTCMVRLYVSRGPGSFGPDPYDSVGSQLYIVVTTLKTPSPEKIKNGVKVNSSTVSVKPGFLATLKSCNYLPNVLMKKEAVDGGADFTAGWDEEGFLAEGPTENLAIVTARRELLVPDFSRTLAGTTVTRCMELAQSLLERGILSAVQHSRISRAQVESAAELLVFGTTLEVLAAVSFDGRTVGSGTPGPVFSALQELLHRDIQL